MKVLHVVVTCYKMSEQLSCILIGSSLLFSKRKGIRMLLGLVVEAAAEVDDFLFGSFLHFWAEFQQVKKTKKLQQKCYYCYSLPISVALLEKQNFPVCNFSSELADDLGETFAHNLDTRTSYC